MKSANRVGLTVADIVLEPIASAEAVLSPEEKELGVAMVDIGGGTTDITVFHNGAIKHTAVLPLGGNHLTNDIAAGLRTPASAAEEIKRRYGAALTSIVHQSETIEVPSTGGREPRVLPRVALAEIIQPRMEEILHLVHRELLRSGFDEFLAGGVVLTGGSVLLQGTSELAEQTFHLPVRIGYPTGVGGLVDVVNSPAYATGVGLVLYGARSGEYKLAARNAARNGKPPRPVPVEGLFHRVRSRMSEWFSERF